MLVLLFGALATASPWHRVGNTDSGFESRVRASAEVDAAPVDMVDLYVATTDWSAADAERLARLDSVTAEVRQFESQSDGELLIIRELQEAAEAIEVLRDESDAVKLFDLLAYQGATASFFFADELPTDERAEPFRREVNGNMAVLPWLNAAALSPSREVTPYIVPEASERALFNDRRTDLASVAPAVIKLTAPAGFEWRVDGRTVRDSVNVYPGRHYVHVEREGRIYGRWRLDLQSADLEKVVYEGPSKEFATWASAPNSAPPKVWADAVSALGGELFLSNADEGTLHRVTPESVESLKVLRPETADGQLLLAANAGLGWTYDANFYSSVGGRAPTVGTTNSAHTSVGGELQLGVRVLLFSAGADFTVPLGANHTVLTANRNMRVRPTLYAAAGIKYVQAMAGYTFPYHPSFGGRVRVPFTESYGLVAHYRVGLPGTMERKNRSIYERGAYYSSGLSFEYRLGL